MPCQPARGTGFGRDIGRLERIALLATAPDGGFPTDPVAGLELRAAGGGLLLQARTAGDVLLGSWLQGGDGATDAPGALADPGYLYNRSRGSSSSLSYKSPAPFGAGRSKNGLSLTTTRLTGAALIVVPSRARESAPTLTVRDDVARSVVKPRMWGLACEIEFASDGGSTLTNFVIVGDRFALLGSSCVPDLS